VDGDQNEQTSDDTMAFIMMFDSPESTRFAVWNWGDDPHSSAWDWQYVVRLPEVGRTYRQRARMVYKRFQGPDDVLAEFQAWRDASPPAEGGAVLPLRSLPAILSPGENGHNPVLLADKAVQQDPAFALAAYRRLLGAPAYQALAAEHIDALFDRANDLAGLIAVWESVAAEDSRGALAWGRLGSARLRAGDIEQAAGAFQRGLDRDANDRQCRLGMGTVSVLQGGLEDGLALLDGLVAESPGHARPAGKACADAAGAHARAGRGDIALQLYQRAMAYWPDDLGFCLEYGELLQSMGRDAEALGQYRSIVTRDPEAPHTSQLIDGIYARWNDATGRVEEWRAVVGMHPDACIPRWCLGMALENAGDFAGAETAFRDAIQRGPKQQEPKIWLGAVIAAAGDLGGGLDLMEGAVDALPELAGAAAEACARAAKARFAAGDLSGALTLLRCARILSPTDLRHAVLFGETLEAAGDDDGALSEYRTVVGQVPDSPHSSARMDAILEKRGEKAARVEEWRGLAAANPDAAIPQLHLGLALEALGDMAGAEAAYCKALSLDPEAESGSACFKRVKTHREGDR
jgi:tetratricopeptide (TPR) repeat protein